MGNRKIGMGKHPLLLKHCYLSPQKKSEVQFWIYLFTFCPQGVCFLVEREESTSMSFQVTKRMSLFGSFITFAALNCVYMIVVKSSFVMSGICFMANVHLLCDS